MYCKSIDVKDIPTKGRRSGKFGEREEMILSMIYGFADMLNKDPTKNIEIIDSEHVFNNNNDLRRTYQTRINECGYKDKMTITMRRGRVFLMNNDSYKELLLKEA